MTHFRHLLDLIPVFLLRSSGYVSSRGRVFWGAPTEKGKGIELPNQRQERGFATVSYNKTKAAGYSFRNPVKPLIATCIRHAKELLDLDLTPCSTWLRFLEVHYQRPAPPIPDAFETEEVLLVT